MARVILAAGAVLWRRRPPGGPDVEVAVVHRPRYDDWSLPKGKADAGETALETALREVAEETGFQARPGAELGTSRYQSLKGPKIVRYWEMEAVDGEFRPGDEVDQLRWLPPDQAIELLSYDRDRQILRRFRT